MRHHSLNSLRGWLRFPSAAWSFAADSAFAASRRAGSWRVRIRGQGYFSSPQVGQPVSSGGTADARMGSPARTDGRTGDDEMGGVEGHPGAPGGVGDKRAAVLPKEDSWRVSPTIGKGDSAAVPGDGGGDQQRCSCPISPVTRTRHGSPASVMTFATLRRWHGVPRERALDAPARMAIAAHSAACEHLPSWLRAAAAVLAEVSLMTPATVTAPALKHRSSSTRHTLRHSAPGGIGAPPHRRDVGRSAGRVGARH